MVGWRKTGSMTLPAAPPLIFPFPRRNAWAPAAKEGYPLLAGGGARCITCQGV